MALAHAIVLALGSLLVGVPIVLHLLMQPKPKLVTFPALQFVRQTRHVNQRRLRLRHWILLLLRCVLLAALILAFARPSTLSNLFGSWLAVAILAAISGLVLFALLATLVCAPNHNRLLLTILGGLLLALLVALVLTLLPLLRQDRPAILGDQQAPVAAALIVDTSPRMNYQHENRTRLQRAQELGRWLIDQLPDNSQVAVVTTEGDQPFFSVDIAAAQKRLGTLETRYLASTIPQEVQNALQLLRENELLRKELYIFTDLTQSSWVASDADQVKSALQQMPEISLFVIDVGVAEPANFSVGPLHLASSQVARNGLLEIETTISCSGAGGQRLVRMQLEKPDLTRPVRRDGRTLVPNQYWSRSRSVDLHDDSQTSVQFLLDEQLPEGLHQGWIEIEGDDALAVDNRRYFTIQVQDAWKVLVAAPDGVSVDNLQETISPFAERQQDASAFACTVIHQDDLDREDLSRYHAVCLLDPLPLSDPAWFLLHRYVESGGGLAIFLGPNAGAEGIISPQFNTDAAIRIMPGRLDNLWRNTDESLFLNPTDYSHEILQPFRSMASRVPWHRFPIHRHWGIQPDTSTPDAQVTVLVRFGNGMPAFLQRRVGLGVVLLSTTPITEPARPDERVRWNDLFLGDCWPAWLLVRQTCQFLVAGGSQQLSWSAGQAVTLANDERRAPSQYWIFSPRDEDPARVESVEGEIRYRFTESPGPYRLKGERDGVVIRGFSVNLDPAATDLTRLASQQLDERLGAQRYQQASDQEQIRRKQDYMRVGQEFYPLLVMMMIVVLAAEYVMSNRFYQSASSQPGRNV